MPTDITSRLMENKTANTIDKTIKERTFKVALFDLDGTLFDTEDQYTIFWGEIGRRFRPDIPNFEHVIKGTTLKQIYERYFPDSEIQAQINPQLEAYEAQMKYEFFPGVRKFIDDIRNHGVKCAIVTSSDTKKMQNVYRAMPEFKSLFDRILMAEMFKRSKPAPDCYLLGAEVFEADISECVVFEDAYNGLEAGMASGIYTIGIATGHTPEEIADKCHHVITTFEGMDYNSINSIINS